MTPQSKISNWCLILSIAFIQCLIMTSAGESFGQNTFSIEQAGHFGGHVHCSAVKGNYTYLGQGQHFHILDNTGATFQKLGYMQLRGKPLAIDVSNNHAYVYLQSGSGFQVIDVSDPNAPVEAGFSEMPGVTDGWLFVNGNHAYIATYDNGIKIVNVSNPASPTLITTYDDGSDFKGVTVLDDMLYTIHGNTGQLVILDVSTPAALEEKSKTNLPFGRKNDLFAKDNFVHIASASNPTGLLIYDVTDPVNPTEASRFETTVNGSAKDARRVFVEGQTAYVACAGSLWLFAVDVTDPQTPTEISKVDLNDQETPSPIAVHAATPDVYVTANWTDTFLYQVDITDPANPETEKQFSEPREITHSCYLGQYLYTATPNGIFVYDISTTPEDPVFLKSYPEWTFKIRLFCKDNTLYALGRTELHIIDATDPANLVGLSGAYPIAGNYANDIFVYGTTAYVTLGGSGGLIEFVDGSDPANPVKAGDHQLPGPGWDIFVKGGSTLAYAVYGTLDADHGFQIIDVDDPANPMVLSTTATTGQPMSIWVDADTAYVGSNTRAGDDDTYHLESFDVSDTALPLLLNTNTGEGSIWDIRVENDYVFTAIHGGTVKTYKYADMIASASSPSTQSFDKTPADETGKSTGISSEGYADFPIGDKTADEGAVTYTITGPVLPQGTMTVAIRPVALAGTVTPMAASGVLNALQPVKATASDGWAFGYWINASPNDNPNAACLLLDPPNHVICWFNPLMELLEGPENPGYQPVCLPADEGERTNTPITQIVLMPSHADDWDVNSITFHTDGQGLADDVLMTYLRLDDSTGVKLDSCAFGPALTYQIPAAHKRIAAGGHKTFMVTYDFKYQENPDFSQPKDFWAWTNRDNIAAVPVNYGPGEIEPDPDPERTVQGGPTVLGCVHNLSTREVFTTIGTAVGDGDTQDGHTLMVCPGTYTENVDVDHELTIYSQKGYDHTTVKAAINRDHVFHVMKNNTTIRGFTIEGADDDGKAGIRIHGSTLEDVTVEENYIHYNDYGVSGESLNRADIRYNRIISNNADGIHLDGLALSSLSHNTVRLSKGHGIYIEGCIEVESGDTTYVSSNRVELNDLSGIHITTSKRIQLNRQNVVQKNKLHGLEIVGCEGIRLVDSHFSDNDGNGVDINESDDVTIGSNGIEDNRMNGIHVWNQSENTFIGDPDDDIPCRILGNTMAGILIEGEGTDSTTVVYCDIGINLAGDGKKSNVVGIHIKDEAEGCIIGGSRQKNEENVISGNTQFGVLIEGWETSGNVLLGNNIGTDRKGEIAIGNKHGICIRKESANNIIGHTDFFKRCLISGNDSCGVWIRDVGTILNDIIRNSIGVQGVDVAKKLPNLIGVRISHGAQHTTVGGEIGTSGNTISGNSYCGVMIDGEETSLNSVLGNNIGTDAVNNDIGNEFGVIIKNKANYNSIGMDIKLLRENFISCNDSAGVLIEGTGTTKNYVIGNFIGTNRVRNADLGNHVGVLIRGGATDNLVGDDNGDGSMNVISGNTLAGVLLDGEKTKKNRICHNAIGIGVEFKNAVPNLHGVVIQNKASENYIGMTPAAGKGNVISGNADAGVLIQGHGTRDNVVSGNWIGADSTSTVRLPNIYGIVIKDGAWANIIGGVLNNECNVISGNREFGIVIRDENTGSNHVMGNKIGTTKTGADTLSNKNGILIYNGASLNYIGWYLDEGRGNLISGNRGYGVGISGKGTSVNQVKGNLIGTDITGTRRVPNEHGVIIDYKADGNTIGGNEKAERNVISGNRRIGISIFHLGTNRNEVFGNYIGTDIQGEDTLSNWSGVWIADGPRYNKIGANSSNGWGNVISGNRGSGVFIEGRYTDYNKVRGNKIGTDESGQYKVPNRTGVTVKDFANHNEIGGEDDDANVISGNTHTGVWIKYTQYNKVFNNSIGTNKARGEIDLGNEVGVSVSTSEAVEVYNNRIWYNYKGIADTASSRNLKIYGNDIYNSWSWDKCGIYLHNSNAEVVGNVIHGDKGDAIVCDNGATPLIRKNTIMDNAGFGLHNFDNQVTIDARDNWWGAAGGPDGGGQGVSGSADYSDWRTAPVDLYVIALQDTLFIPAGDTDSLGCHVQNLQNLNDAADVTVTDSLGWLGAGQTLSVAFRDSLGADTLVVVSVPEETSMGTKNKLYVQAISKTDPAWMDTDSLIVLVYESALERIAVSPDSIELEQEETWQFTAQGQDQYGNPIEAAIEWTATGGTIDDDGLYTAGVVTGMFEVTATDPVSGMSATAVVEIIPDTPVEQGSTDKLPTHFALGQNYPNPFNPETIIPFSVKERCHVQLVVYDIRGREIKRLVDEVRQPGFYTARFDAQQLPTGLYIYSIQMKDFRDVKKMVLME